MRCEALPRSSECIGGRGRWLGGAEIRYDHE